jgi:dihydropteroate synthase
MLLFYGRTACTTVSLNPKTMAGLILNQITEQLGLSILRTPIRSDLNRQMKDISSSFLGSLRVGPGEKIRLIGVINLTRNSFYNTSVKLSEEEILASALKMQSEGADVIDLGARSTAPYRSYDIPEHVEERLLKNAVKTVVPRLDIEVSADTTRLSVARAAFSAGATILNDVYGLTEKNGPNLGRLVADRSDSSIIIAAHEKRKRKDELDPFQRVVDALDKSISIATLAGVPSSRITIDPGIGFFSSSRYSPVEWNLTAILRIPELSDRFHLPICVGLSRKRFLGTITGGKPAEERLYASLAATTVALLAGCHIVRTHDVGATRDAVRVLEEFQRVRKSLRAKNAESLLSFEDLK